MATLKRHERFQDARLVHNQHNKQTMDEVSTATGISKSLIQALEDEDQARSVGYDKVATLAKHYGVSSDYLLGLTPNPTTDTNLSAVCEYTGLSQGSVQFLSFFRRIGDHETANVLDILIDDSRYHKSDGNRSYRSILNLLNFFFSFSNSSNRKQVFINGLISDRNDTDGFISSNAIALDDTIIENAVLAEIQHALISLKKSRLNEK